MMKTWLTILASTMVAGVGDSLHRQAVEYRHGDTVLEGYLAYSDRVQGKRPGVLVVHEWYGLGRYPKARADKLAELGYLAFALDMYGKGILARDNDQAAQLAGIYKGDRQLMRGRARAGLEVLGKHELADTGRLAAIGYCFGGTTALELARSGADLAGVVSFHGGLATPDPADGKNIRGKILVLHGADDPLVGEEEVLAFQEEMRQGGVDWQMNTYGGAVHSFTNPDAGNNPLQGVAYNEKADRRSWDAMQRFFAEIFK